ncbi:histidine phosphatase family protein [Roseobacter sinensis]|uniref:Histidine phosphatase family protein n=1 Tax=Roseobacter sinensis TaxID=2931391 RepID=A0ABT3BBX4_9RHOB|nr:histidine phosphatase family protein [Roseobacter sp. WL0113]MCV3271060.1 histidine phosphatase family protein [Roseobacter sp. WL0113]
MYPPLYILRHGQTEWNAQHRIQGGLDSPLTPLGQEQARAQRQILQAQTLDGFRAYASPQGRAVQTAAIALEGLFPQIETDARLAEIGVGAWEGLQRSELKIDGVVDESEESALHLYNRAPGGEGFVALRARCRAFLGTLQTPSVLVTHGITSRMLRLIVLDRDLSEIGMLPGGQGVIYHLENGAMRQLSIGG